LYGQSDFFSDFLDGARNVLPVIPMAPTRDIPLSSADRRHRDIVGPVGEPQ
jgi:hypothetical protein